MVLSLNDCLKRKMKIAELQACRYAIINLVTKWAEVEGVVFSLSNRRPSSENYCAEMVPQATTPPCHLNSKSEDSKQLFKIGRQKIVLYAGHKPKLPVCSLEKRFA